MQTCEFCDAGIDVRDGAVVPGTAMIQALRTGYGPTSCPNWPHMYRRMGAALERERQGNPQALPPVDDGAILNRWHSFLATPERSWRLCNTCFSTLGPFLPLCPPPPAGLAYPDDPALKYVLPVNTSVWAILAGYAGLFAVLLFPAPIALVLGIVALSDIRRHKAEKRGGKGRAIFAVVMGGLFSLLLALLLLALFLGN